jgi:hypothetical protein
VTLLVMSQELAAGMLPAASANAVPLTVAVTEPVQPTPVMVPAGAAVLTKPLG